MRNLPSAMYRVLAAVSLFLPLNLLAAARPASTLLRGGLLIDGSGKAPKRADLRMVGERIVALGDLRVKLEETVLDISGKILAPGFIDIHNHSAGGFTSDPLAVSQIAQGITTVVIGPDGSSSFPVGVYLEELLKNPVAVNVGTMVGHGTLRSQVMGTNSKRVATTEEIQKMVTMVESAMRDGALGLSTGLEYDPGFYSTTEEVVALAKVAGKFSGFYMSHMRDESDKVMDSIRELIKICRSAGLPGQISHLKLGTVGVWGKTGEAIRLVSEARRAGLDITADCYPYTAWASGLSVLVPSREFEDPAAVRKGLEDVGGAERVTITSSRAFPDYQFKTLAQIAEREKSDAVSVFIKIMKNGGASIVCRSMTEEDVRVFYRVPWVMVASDGGIGMRHPRGAGTFPRVLGAFSRDEKVFSLAEAVRKCAALPAKRLHLKDRGQVKKGAFADLVVFDPQKVRDLSTFAEPLTLPIGIDYVFINGKLVWDKGKATGARPGKVIRRWNWKPY